MKLQEQNDWEWAEGFCDKHIDGPYADAERILVARLTENRLVGMYPRPHRAVPLDAKINWDEMACDPITEDAMITLDVDGSSGDKTLEYEIACAMRECFVLFKERQRKYGPGNIARSGELGCLIRMSDKAARLENVYIKGNDAHMPDDSLEDAWKDSSVYALIALLCHRGKWPGWTPTQRSLVGGPATAPLDPPPSGGC